MYVHCWACVLFYALSSFYARIACFESYIDKTMAFCVRARVLLCVCVHACRLARFLILNTAYHFLQSLSSLFPVFLHISAIYRAEKSELQIWMEFIILLFVHHPRYFCAQLLQSIHCCFCLLQCTFMCV